MPVPSSTPGRVTAPPTPVIIASPTFTPTPFTHVVQEGETLISIAVQYGLSVEALQAANPTVQPQFLSIGMVLIIPGVVGGTPVVAVAPVPTPAPMALASVQCHPLPTGALHCLTEARNVGTSPVESVAVRLVLADAAGLPLASQVAYAPLEVVWVGESTPLGAIFQPVPPGVAGQGAELVVAEAVLTPTAALRLDLPSLVGLNRNEQWVVSGQVQNPHAQPTTTVWVVLALYDAANELIGYRKVVLPFGLGAGELRDFEVAAGAFGPVDHYTLLAEGKP